MKKNMLILFSFLLLSGCKKEWFANKVPEPYINNFIKADTINPYKGSYYIHVSFKTLGTSNVNELTFTETDQTMISISHQSFDNVMIGKGMALKDSATGESLGISFYFIPEIDMTFKLFYANYRFADSWKNVTGVNVHYYKPVGSAQPNAAYLYEGRNTRDSFFNITYIGKDRLNGEFHTQWREVSGLNVTYDMYGDFSIPRLFHSNTFE